MSRGERLLIDEVLEAAISCAVNGLQAAQPGTSQGQDTVAAHGGLHLKATFHWGLEGTPQPLQGCFGSTHFSAVQVTTQCTI